MTATSIAVYTTLPTREEARRVAEALVARRLAACAQISEIESYYVWGGALQHDTEYRLLLKTVAERYDEVERAILDLHPYELPAVHAVAVERIHPPYAQWVGERSAGSAPPAAAPAGAGGTPAGAGTDGAAGQGAG